MRKPRRAQPYLLVAALASLAFSANESARASHSVASFYTPEKAAFCKYVIPMGFPGPTGLECWTPNDGFTVWMRPNGVARKAYMEGNRLRYATAHRRLTFQQNWWGSDLNGGGRSYDLEYRYREGTGVDGETSNWRATGVQQARQGDACSLLPRRRVRVRQNEGRTGLSGPAPQASSVRTSSATSS